MIFSPEELEESQEQTLFKVPEKNKKSLNKSRSLDRNFTSKFQPPKTLGSNTINVQMGDYKAQAEADKI